MNAALPVSAVIVSYNRAADLRRCLDSLHRLSPGIAEVIVVDNGSTDGTPAMLRQDFAWVRLVEAGCNLGPCVARNRAAGLSAQPVLWFLDSDTEAASPDAAARLHAVLRADPGLAAVGGEALLDAAGRSIGVKRLRCGRGGIIQGDAVFGADPAVSGCQVIASCNLMLRRADFERLGGFDPFYFFFYEDMDLTWRAQASGRRLAALSPMPVIHHYSEAVRIRNLWWHARNRMYFCLKTRPLADLLLLPLHDLAFLLNPANLRRLGRRARQPEAAVSGVSAEAGPAAPKRAILARAAMLAAQLGGTLLLGYVALPLVLRPALAARRRATPAA
jgi:GT2 family glycosyltransferase